MCNDTLTDDELLDDVLARAFVMMLGVNMPSKESLEFMKEWVIIGSKENNIELNEEYILRQIPNFITYLYRR
tara:strand:- start:77 stop:292 length:216 start_codon:yes stop_codon:yes gene_type:complete